MDKSDLCIIKEPPFLMTEERLIRTSGSIGILRGRTEVSYSSLDVPAINGGGFLTGNLSRYAVLKRRREDE